MICVICWINFQKVKVVKIREHYYPLMRILVHNLQNVNIFVNLGFETMFNYTIPEILNPQIHLVVCDRPSHDFKLNK